MKSVQAYPDEQQVYNEQRDQQEAEANLTPFVLHRAPLGEQVRCKPSYLDNITIRPSFASIVARDFINDRLANDSQSLQSRVNAVQGVQALLTEESTLPYSHESSVRFSSAPAHDLYIQQQTQLLRDSRCLPC